MCFPDPPDPPPPPPPDLGLEAQKFASFQESSERIKREKEGDTARSRGLTYGLFGTRSLLGFGDQPGGMLKPKAKN